MAIAVALWPAAASAESSRGGSFRLPDYGARGWGMGGAAIATVNDESAVEWNPAQLALLQSHVVGASYVNLVPGTTARQSQIAYARVIERRADDTTIARHAAGVQYTNLHLQVAGGESYDENHVRLAYAYTPDPFLTFAAGATVFFSSSDIPNFGAIGSSIDFALRVNLTRSVNIGLVGHDLFSRYNYDDGSEFSKTRSVILGVATTAIPYARAEFDIAYEHGSYSRTMIGAESDYIMGHLTLRAGFASLSAGETRSIPYFGLGIRGGKAGLVLHYAASFDDGDEAFGNTHRFSLGLWF